MEYSSAFLEDITSSESDVSESDDCSCEADCKLEAVCVNQQLEVILPFLQVPVLKSLLKVHQMFLISKYQDHQ